MKNLYIIGNGFDLHHGIPSSYYEYMTWLRTYFPLLYKEIEHTFQGAHKESWWADFENGLGRVNYFYNVHSVRVLEYKVGDVELKGKKSPTRLMALYDAIQVSFSKWVETLLPDIKAVTPDLSLNVNALYLNFNYTTTLQEAYHVPDENVLHIHGKAMRGDKVIIGHHSNGRQFPIIQEELVGIVPGTIKMKMAIAKFRKPTSKLIMENHSFFESLTGIERITVCGFSFSMVDIPYIHEILKHLSGKVMWDVYIHSDRDKEHMATVQKGLKLPMNFIEW